MLLLVLVRVLLLLLLFVRIAHADMQCMESAFSNDLLGRSDWVSSNLSFAFGRPEDYSMTRFLGAGTYGDVYGGFFDLTVPVVFKVFTNKPTVRRMRKFMKEISFLKDACGHPNLVKMVDILPFNGSRTVPVVVLEKIPGHYLNMALYNQLTDRDNQFYLYELLKAIRFLHDERGIIHRDIKPKNVMVDHETRTLKLLDFGISKYYQKGDEWCKT
jgi:casein kinase II subunit alpha